MGFWNELEHAASAVGHGVTDAASFTESVVGKAIPTPVKDALDQVPGAVSDVMKYSGIDSVFSADNWMYSHVYSRPLSTAATLVGEAFTDPGALTKADGWARAWEVAQHRSFGQSVDLAMNNYEAITHNQYGSTIDPLHGDAYARLHKLNPTIATVTSGLIDAGAHWFLDPLVGVGKGIKVAKLATQVGKITEADRAVGVGTQSVKQTRGALKIAGVPVAYSKKFGMASRTAALIGTMRDGKYVPGLIDKVGSGEEFYQALPQFADQGVAHARTFSQELYETTKIPDQATALNQRRLLMNVWRGDPNAIAHMQNLAAAQHDISGLAARKAEDAEVAQFNRSKALARTPQGWQYNWMRAMNRMANVRDAATLRSDHAVLQNDMVSAFTSHGLAPTHAAWQADPDQIARLDNQLQSMRDLASSIDKDALRTDQMLKGQGSLGFTPSVTARGSRRLAKMQGIGLARNGALHTGFGRLDSLADRSVNRPLQRLYAWQPNAVPLRVLHAIPVKTAHGIQWSVDSFWNVRPEGTWNLNDENETTTQMRAYMRKAGMSADRQNNYLSQLALIPHQQYWARKLVADKMVHEAVRTIAAKHGITDADKFLTELTQRGMVKRDNMLAALKGRAYTATRRRDADLTARQAEAKASGKGVRTWYADMIDDDNVPVSLPILDTQSLDVYVAPDVNELSHVFSRHAGVMHSLATRWEQEDRAGLSAAGKRGASTALHYGLTAADNAQDALMRMAESVNRAWKFATLFRLGFLQRVLMDDHQRILAAYGAQTLLHGIRDGVQNTAYNAFHNPVLNFRAAQKIRAERDILSDTIGSDAEFAGNQDAWKEIRSIQKRLPKLKSATRKRELQDRLSVLLDFHPEDKAEAKARLDELTKILRSGSYRTTKRRIGEGEIAVHDGTRYEAAFQGEYGEIARAAAGSVDSWNGQLGSYIEKRYAQALERTGSYERYTPEQVGELKHLFAWEQTVNHQLRYSDLVKQVLSGKSDAEIKTWLRTDPRGRTIARELPYQAANTQRWINGVRDMVDQYLPSEALQDAVRKGRRITVDDLKAAVPEVADRPEIHGASLEANTGESGAGRVANQISNRFFKWVGGRNDAMSRHPLFVTVYNREVQRLHDVAVDVARKQGRKLTSEDANRVVQNARLTANRMVKRYLFDVSGETEMAHMFHLLAPFFNAWQEGMNRWWRIVSQDPSVLGRWQMVFDAPRKMGIEVDQNGNPVKPEAFISDNHYLLLQLPKSLGGPDPKKVVSQFHIPESSFNLIFQGGGLFNPGAGPFIQVPANEFTIKHPQVEKYLKALLPMGTTPSLTQQFVPPEFQDLGTLVANFMGTHTRQYNSMNSMLTQQLAEQFVTKHHRYPTPAESGRIRAEAERETASMAALRLATAALAPVSVQAQSKFAPYLDAMRSLQSQGIKEKKPYFWPEQQFLKRYGNDYFLLTQSSSLNNTGLPSTVGAVNAVKAHRSLLDQMSDAKMWRLVVGPEGQGAYSQAARDYFYQQETLPGSNQKMVEQAAPLAALNSAETQAGWNDYTKNMAVLQLAANRAGLTSYLQSPNLMQAKQLIVQGMAQNNPTWYQDYMTNDDALYEQQLGDMATIVKDKSLLHDPARPDIQGLKQYLEVRSVITHILAVRKANGMSGSPQAQSNQTLMAAFAQYVSGLVEQNPMFEKYDFNGMVEHDPYLATSTAASAVLTQQGVA